MMNYKGWAIPEGNVVKVEDAAGNVLWAVSGGKVILEVEKITSNTYAGETTYTGEQFILLDIYPKTNGTVSVTYGGLTKTITDTSGAAEPNAQQVFFGTFNGVSDSVETPASGELTIEGDCKGFAVGYYDDDPKSLIIPHCSCISAVNSFGSVEFIPNNAFRGCSGLTSITIPEAVTSIGGSAFFGCSGLTSITIPEAVTSIGSSAFYGCSGLTNIIVASGNTNYYSSGNCLIETATQTLIAGCKNSVIPEAVTSIGHSAFGGCSGLTSITIPEAVTSIGTYAFDGCSGLTSITFNNTSGWYVTQTSGATSGTDVDVTDTANNVTLITDTYSNNYWYRVA